MLFLANVAPYVSAASGLAGVAIGGTIAGGVSLNVARQTREAAQRAWVRDSRRAIYDRFMVAGQSLLHEMEAAKATAGADNGPRDEARACSKRWKWPKQPPTPSTKVRATIDAAYSTFVGTYASVQTVAQPDVVRSAREQMYLLEALKSILDGGDWFASDQFDRIAECVRFARQDTIDAMRADLELDGKARPQTDKSYKEAVREAVAKATSEHPHLGTGP